MKFRIPLLLLTNVFTYVSAEAAGAGTALDVRSHARDFVTRASNALRNLDLSKRAAPPVPAGKDATRLHIWIRPDERPSTYNDRSGAKHDGLNQLMKDTGGRHKEVVIGNTKGYYEYGLQFNDPNWQKRPNGDGAAVSDYAGPYVEAKGGHEYKGGIRTEISGKVYNYKSYHCGTFATRFSACACVTKLDSRKTRVLATPGKMFHYRI